MHDGEWLLQKGKPAWSSGAATQQTNTGWSQENRVGTWIWPVPCAPDARCLLVEADSATFQNLATSVNTAGRHGVRMRSATAMAAASLEARHLSPSIIMRAFAVTVSSGDGGFGVEFPASSPHVTAVGGTSLVRSSNSRGWSETGLERRRQRMPAPFTQSPHGRQTSGCARRTVADVSAVADPNTRRGRLRTRKFQELRLAGIRGHECRGFRPDCRHLWCEWKPR